jgi:hypothetical protein
MPDPSMTPLGTLESTERPAQSDPPRASVPSPDVLRAYGLVSPDLPFYIVKVWRADHSRNFWYATTALIIGGLLAISLIGGFVYLVMQQHGGYAAGLLGAGAFGMVAGFRASRL